ncbi:MAG: bifunctional demethylmenaquinone methyltransferase/2-methoxy-6-polyprenyl-1,4-benzoquinol methylase UbiE [Thermomicrobiales bacterium]|nr:bifunctional demethylmenaquinone methyltransferase/2-methoxy-6-polyprenyl-1,4-benzoquinol methylase UbiE [Thermomicrobiales bacterium]MCO5221420.1 bifunctional demethylmenaquinone methyltransferase/2-methoxy-6-polyprenyl-1,4-benzoquinol methylase UbiE [Thermomicrobiales bacterium]
MTESRPRNPGAIAEPATVRAMFDRIVPRYDLMNHLMTFGMDLRWRKLIATRAAAMGDSVLDVATGTGDVAFDIRAAGARTVIGLDFSPEMIGAARTKGAARGSDIEFLIGDAMALPFPDNSFDACTVSFGLRNMPDYAAAIAEMTRVLRPGGRFVCLEMTPYRKPVLGRLFSLYFEKIVPIVGGVLSGDIGAYRYLPQSVANFPASTQLVMLMRAAGLTNTHVTMLGFGTVAIHTGTKELGSGS